MNRKGFTLIELVIVCCIIGILAVIAIPGYIGQQKNATRSEAYTSLQNLALLEAQFFAENGRYTVTLGAAGADQQNNIQIIQQGGGDQTNALPGFKPGGGGVNSFSYRIVSQTGVGLPTTVPIPYNNTTLALIPNTVPCFIATATGNTNSRVQGDVFAIDCNNYRNF